MTRLSHCFPPFYPSKTPGRMTRLRDMVTHSHQFQEHWERRLDRRVGDEKVPRQGETCRRATTPTRLTPALACLAVPFCASSAAHGRPPPCRLPSPPSPLPLGGTYAHMQAGIWNTHRGWALMLLTLYVSLRRDGYAEYLTRHSRLWQTSHDAPPLPGWYLRLMSNSLGWTLLHFHPFAVLPLYGS